MPLWLKIDIMNYKMQECNQQQYWLFCIYRVNSSKLSVRIVKEVIQWLDSELHTEVYATEEYL